MLVCKLNGCWLESSYSRLKIVIKKSMCQVDMEYHLIVQVHGVLIMTLLETLELLLLTIVYHVMLRMVKITF